MTDRRLPTALLSVALLAGCTQWRHYELGQPIGEATVPDAADGWTRADALARFGPPLRFSAEPGGYVMAWEYLEVDEYKVGFGLGFAGADFLDVDFGRARSAGDFLLMSFDSKHRLRSVAFEEWDRSAGGGQGVQPLVSAVDVVDVGDLLDEFDTHRWGLQSLRGLPTTLNQQNRLDSGASGLERRGGSSRVGQHALELD